MTEEQTRQLQELLDKLKEERTAYNNQLSELTKEFHQRVDKLEQRLEQLAVEIKREVRNYGR